MDRAKLEMQNISLSMSTSNADVGISLSLNEKRIIGQIKINRGEEQIVDIDTTLNYTIDRGELYMLLPVLNLKLGDTLSFKTFVHTSMQVSDTKVYYEGEEVITTAMGTFECDKIYLETDGKMPENRIWIDKTRRRIIKFYVPKPQLHIELNNTLDYR